MLRFQPRCAALLLAAALPLAASAASNNLFLNLPGLKGPSETEGYKDAITPSHFLWGATSEIVVSGEKRSAGTVQIHDLTWDQALDSSLLGLLGYASTEEAKLHALAWPDPTGKLNKPYLTLAMQGPTVTSVRTGLSAGSAQQEVSATLGANRFSLSYDPQGLGQSGKPVTVSLDRLKNTTSGMDTRAAAPLQNPGDVFGSQGDRIFLRLGSDKDGRVIAGDSQVGGWQNWIELDSAQFGMTRPLSLLTGGDKPGPVTLEDLSWSQRLDGSLPAMLANLGKGSGMREAVIEVVHAGDTPRTTLQLTLQDVYFTSVLVAGADDGLPVVEGSMNFSGFTATMFSDDIHRSPMSRTYDARTGKFSDGVRVADPLDNFGKGLQGFYSIGAAGSETSPGLPAPSQPVPEPQTWALWLLGAGLLRGAMRRPIAA